MSEEKDCIVYDEEMFEDSCCGTGCCQDLDDCEETGFARAEIGYMAPDFYLDGYFKKEMSKYSLSQFEGKWTVLFFYPLDFTFVCPTEVLELSKRHKEFEDLDAQVLGVSVDSVYSHEAWSKQIGELNFPLISDFNKDTSMDYGVLHDEGMSLRGTFIIDPEGILRSYTVNDLNVGRNVDEILRTIQALKTGELCQIGWTPGDETLGEA